MTIHILNNQKRKGIFCGSTEIKLSQFTDDTTLILDGITQSLQTALNVLEVFRSLSGLQVNTEKNSSGMDRKEKVLQRKLLRLTLQWDLVRFSMLGLSL